MGEQMVTDHRLAAAPSKELGDSMEKYYLPGKDTWHNAEIVGESYREAQITAALGRRPKLDEEIEQVAEALLIPEPDNPHDANAISVRVRGHVVGYLPRELADAYRPALHRIAASGLVATTTARICAVVREPWNGDNTPKFFSNIRIYLPEPNQILPLNNDPWNAVAILPWGGALQVTGEDKHFDYLSNYVPKSGDGLVLLTMHRLVQNLKNGTEKNLVEVRLDGERVGQLSAVTSGHYLPTIAHTVDMGRELGIWAKIKGSGLAVELVIQGARASELNGDWVQRLPTLPQLIPEAQIYNVPPAFRETERALGRQGPATQPTSTPRPLPGSFPVPSITPAPAPTGPGTEPVKGPAILTDKDRKHSPVIHRAAGVALIIIGVLVGGLLAAIPGIGPVLFLGCLTVGIMGNVRFRRVAKALEAERAQLSP
ncbi:HIRAN domain-containing protein [Arthrobacter sp. ISL-30]|uniref:HIRAN domain-containing protein n=1 Tax=Arthrobacter sp. ISL-30 TaxID=2819109 RepID=UPI001BE95FA5|nr:HIRAN domain-containing protein [Arthrobacter sp. ISL-30]MBT2515809.1 HIRAN domain-containing protein [Arthrobacter sp. ISL-30]